MAEKPKRRQRLFTDADKLRILENGEACVRGQLGPYLRREGITYNQFYLWRSRFKQELSSRAQVCVRGEASLPPPPEPRSRSEHSRDLDTYATPPWCVRRWLELQPPSGTYLECAAGDGAIIRAARNVRDDINWVAVEIRPECRNGLVSITAPESVVIGDFPRLAPEWAARSPRRKLYDAVVTNPPHERALEFIEASLLLSDTVVMLLRLSFLASATRHPLLRRHPPDVAVLPNRPTFTNGCTGAADYCWATFGPNHGGRLTILELTSAAERQSVPRVDPRLLGGSGGCP